MITPTPLPSFHHPLSWRERLACFWVLWVRRWVALAFPRQANSFDGARYHFTATLLLIVNVAIFLGLAISFVLFNITESLTDQKSIIKGVGVLLSVFTLGCGIAAMFFNPKMNFLGALLMVPLLLTLGLVITDISPQIGMWIIAFVILFCWGIFLATPHWEPTARRLFTFFGRLAVLTNVD